MLLAKIRAKFPYLKSDCLIRDTDPRGCRHVPQYPQAKREADTNSHGASDDFGGTFMTSMRRIATVTVSKCRLNPAV